MVLFTAPDRPCLSAGHHRHRPARLSPTRRNGSLIEKDGKVNRLGADRPELRRRQVLPSAVPRPRRTRPAATMTIPAPYNAANSSGRNAADLEGADRTHPGRRREAQGRNPDVPVPVDLVTTSGKRPRSRHHAGLRPLPGPRVAKARGLPEATGPRSCRAQDRGALARPPRRAARQRAAAQPGARRFEVAVTSSRPDGRSSALRHALRPTRS